jgi:hypothetical protein
MTEFNKGHDVINLADIDTNTSDGDNDVFTFIDTAAFSDTTSGSRHLNNASNPTRLPWRWSTPRLPPGGCTLKEGDFVL